jgi:hypothetical protein
MRAEELIAQLERLTLVTIIVMAHNAQELQSILSRWERAGRRLGAEMIRQVSPTAFAQLNFLGSIRFPVERYRDQLLAVRHARSLSSRH